MENWALLRTYRVKYFFITTAVFEKSSTKPFEAQVTAKPNER